MMAMILRDANQNSASPYHETATMLRMRITRLVRQRQILPEVIYLPTRIIAIHTPTLTEIGQYWMTNPAAVTSDASNIEKEYQ